MELTPDKESAENKVEPERRLSAIRRAALTAELNPTIQANSRRPSLVTSNFQQKIRSNPVLNIKLSKASSADLSKDRREKALIRSQSKDLDAQINSFARQRTKKLRLKIRNERAGLTKGQKYVYDFKKAIDSFGKDRRAEVYMLWADSIKFIESKFGTGVASYFLLARFILFLNIILSCLWFFGVILIGLLSLYDSAVDIGGFAVPKSVFQVIQASFTTPMRSIQTFFAGLAPWAITPMFYAGYRPLMLFQHIRMDLIYVTVILLSLMLSLLFILRRIRKEFVSKSSVSTGIGVDEVYPFGVIVLGSWNHSICNQKVKNNHVYAIATALKVVISQIEVANRKNKQPAHHYIGVFFRRCVGFAATIILLGIFSTLLYDSVSSCSSRTNTFLFSVMHALDGTTSSEDCLAEDTVTPFPPYIVSISNVILPPIFNQLASYEKYEDPQWETRTVLARSFVTKIASVYLMLFSLYAMVRSLENRNICWEHEIAKRFYTLIWIDFGITCVMTLVSALAMKLVVKKYEFDITSNILEMVYRQSIIWIGSIFAPAMPIIAVCTTSIIFYIKKWTGTV